MNPTNFPGEGSSEIKLIKKRVNSDLSKQSLEARNKAHVMEGVIKLHQIVEQVSLQAYYNVEIDEQRSS
ncbi:hypothetical protein C1H46_040394 [Malus baccata]|uniref:Uncharacterized protein n=1 Tax=Malus baccata TaxID=106549 RepID=A0A540KIL0_MALBA|nr:hypothetical protein C1H46_040394 [Malus baccata]